LVVALLLAACACKHEPPKPVPVIDQEIRGALPRGQEIQVNVNVGLNRLKLGELLQAFTTELSIARVRAGVKEGIRGPAMLKWVRWLLDEHDELVRFERERAKARAQLTTVRTEGALVGRLFPLPCRWL